jgi:phosphatidylglycerophosphate synthase
MGSFIIIFLILFYFKIARVYRKEERVTQAIVLQHAIVGVSAFFTFSYAFMHFSWWIVLLISFLSFIVSALIVTAIQLGIFVEGKPLFGVSLLYKYLPFLTMLILCFVLILYWA